MATNSVRRMLGEEAVSNLSRLDVRFEPQELERLEGWNNTGVEWPADKCFIELFEAQVERGPHRVAAACDGEELSYDALNRNANRLASLLLTRGVGPEVLVSIYAERGLEFLTAILAVFKAGGAYLPLDPLYPAKRLRQVFEQSETPLILTTREYLPGLRAALADIEPEDRPAALVIEECLEGHTSEENPPPSAGPRNLAYVIFTSGSTGRPKGAMVEHRGMLNHLLAKISDLKLTDADRVAQTASQCFDISVWQFLAVLLAGGQVRIFDNDTLRDPLQLTSRAAAEEITILEIVPSLLRAILDEADADGDSPHRLKSLRWLILTGEALPPGLCRRWLQRLPHVPILNAYGPTECSDDVTHYALTRPPAEDALRVPIGRPIRNTQLYIIAPRATHFELCHSGVSGELCVAGVSVGRGYINDPERTSAAFFKNPFSDDPEARLYRTGDLVRSLPDGNIEFLGRIDSQVKLHGFRVELGEIESVLSRHPNVRECAVVVRGERQVRGGLVARECLSKGDGGAQEHRSLIAYAVCRSKTPASELRSHLKKHLPSYMVPAQFIQLDKLPLNPNGKLDTKALPEPEHVRPEVEADFVPPRDETEAAVAGVWAGVFNLDQVGVRDNFFDLGGDSLLAMQILNRVKQATGVQLSFRDLFGAQTVAELAALVQSRRGRPQAPPPSAGAATPRARHQLSLAQQRLWFLWKLEPTNPYYTFQGVAHLRGSLDLSLLRRAWRAVLERHQILRATFGEEHGEPFQAFESHPVFNPELSDLSGLPEAEREKALRSFAKGEAARAFNLERDPLLRAHLFKLSDGEHALLLTMHEIILDGWATCVLIRDLGELYEGFRRGADFQPGAPAVQFGDFILREKESLQRDKLRAQGEYWRRKLSGELPVLDLPTDRPRSPSAGYLGSAKGVLLDAELSRRLKALGGREHATLFMTLLSANYLLLRAYSGQEDMVIGAPIANHHDQDSESIVGFFLNMLPLRINLSGDTKFTDLLGCVRETVTDALSNSDYPFIWMLEEADAVRDTSFAPVFQVMFNMLSFPHVSLKYDDFEVAFRELETGYTKYDLTFYAQEQDDRIYLQISYLTELFDDETIGRMLRNLEVLLRSIADDPEARISELELLHPSERRALLVDFNLTDKEYDGASSVQELFERQAAATPGRTALIFGDEELSYGELNARANRLAHRLRRAGVGAESLVAVCIERSFDTLVGLLAVVKAGGAYVPLDPGHPPARLEEILEDASPQLLLLQKRLDQFSRYEGPKVYVDDWRLCEDEDCSNPAPVTTPDNLFYVVYTSSTTGKAKGTLIPMRSVLNRLFWMWDAYPFRAGDVAVLQKSYALVAAAWECFGALLKGVPTVIVSRETLLNPPELWRELAGRGVSYLLASPPLLEGLLEQAREQPGGWETLRLATTGAEPVSPETVRRWNQSFPRASLLNLYGSTECSSNATVYDTKGMADGAARVPVGKPLSNVKAYVLDDYLRPVPVGAVGELHVAGACLARGYLNLPELTAEHFVADEFSGRASSRLYRTGDMARFLADGNIELLGRRDDQVKVRGFRVELNDIVTALSKHEMVRRCAVLLREAADGTRHLVAYVETERPLGVSALRNFAREMMPDYMVPTHFLFLEALPLTDAGKVDRRALLKLPLPEQESEAFVAPGTPYEELLAEIWAQTLGVKRVGAHDSFFDLGGHSLLAVQIASRVRDRLQVEVPLRDLYEKPTLRAMAEAVERACRNKPLKTTAGPQERGGSEDAVGWEEGVL